MMAERNRKCQPEQNAQQSNQDAVLSYGFLYTIYRTHRQQADCPPAILLIYTYCIKSILQPEGFLRFI